MADPHPLSPHHHWYYGGPPPRLCRAFRFHARLRAVDRVTRRHIGRPLPQAEVARRCAMTPAAFSRWFRARTGICFSDWLMRVRVGYAARLLDASDISITRAAFAAGFADLRTFQRGFRRVTGMSAREYRARRGPG